LALHRKQPEPIAHGDFAPGKHKTSMPSHNAKVSVTGLGGVGTFFLPKILPCVITGRLHV